MPDEVVEATLPFLADGTLQVDGSGQSFKVTVQGYTGRVTVTKIAGN